MTSPTPDPIGLPPFDVHAAAILGNPLPRPDAAQTDPPMPIGPDGLPVLTDLELLANLDAVDEPEFPRPISFDEIRVMDTVRVWRPDGLSTEGIAWWMPDDTYRGRQWRTVEGGLLIEEVEGDARRIELLARQPRTDEPADLGTVVLGYTPLHQELRPFVRVGPVGADAAWWDTASPTARTQPFVQWPHIQAPSIAALPVAPQTDSDAVLVEAGVERILAAFHAAGITVTRAVGEDGGLGVDLSLIVQALLESGRA